MGKNYIFLGAPGVGKGTLGEIFCKELNLIHISTGQLLRDEMASGSDLGNKVKDLIAGGGLVSDDIVTAMVAKRLAKDDVKTQGCMLDGYPRTVPQAEALKGIFADLNTELTAAVLIEADKNMLVARLTSRRMCSNKECGAIYNLQSLPPKTEGVCDRCGAALYQRSDDSEATVTNRMKVYEEQTAPLIDFYAGQGDLVRVETANGSIEDNYAALKTAVGI